MSAFIMLSGMLLITNSVVWMVILKLYAINDPYLPLLVIVSVAAGILSAAIALSIAD